MICGGMLNKVGFSRVLEEEGDVVHKGCLVCFDGKMVMGFAGGNQIVCDGALGEQGIGSDILVLYVYGIQERDGGFNLIGLFEPAGIGYLQGIDFFWVWQSLL